ncbi:MAG: glycoside hydrolase family 3 N-terminal domain-containing protein [Bacteroidota bacterium]
MRRIVFLFFLVTSLSSFQKISAQKKPFQSDLKRAWVDSTFLSMPLEKQIGQLFMVAAYSNKGTSHESNLNILIDKYGIGGLIFFQGGPVRQVNMLNRLQKKSKIPLMIGMDLEWGLGMRLDSTMSFPRQMTLGALKNDSLIYEMGSEIAYQCKKIGVHFNFAPVVDVNSNPANPVIGTRSFGENKFKVSRKSIAYMKGLQDNGVLANAKHFPGHGDTDRDSHKVLPIVKHDRERLSDLELYPFKQLINSGVSSMMVAHLSVPALDSGDHPTTLSKKVITDLLRDELGFNGLVFTDALNMGGIANYTKPGQMDLAALEAGNDVLLFPGNVPAAIKIIKKRMKSDDDFNRSVLQRVKKILSAKYDLGLNNYSPLATEHLIREINNDEAKALNRKLFTKAVTVVSSDKNTIPIQVLDTSYLASLTIGESKKGPFQEKLDAYAPFAHYFINQENNEDLIAKLSRYTHIIVRIADMSNSRSKKYGLDLSEVEFLKRLSKETKVIVSVFGNAYALKYFEAFDNIICTYQDNIYTQEAVPQIVFGAIAASGKLPVTASEKFREDDGVETKDLKRLGFDLPENVQMDSRTLARIDTIIKYAIKDEATPGCQVLVARNGKIIYNKPFGYFTYDSISSVKNSTLYDLASITKVAATLQTGMFLYGSGDFDFQEPASAYLPELIGSNKELLDFENILSHQAGLLPYIPFWAETIDSSGLKSDLYSEKFSDNFRFQLSPNLFAIPSLKDSIWFKTIHSELREKPEDTCCYDYKYSDIGFYILQRSVESIINQPIQDFVSQNFYRPLGLSTMNYLPLCEHPIDRIAPSEKDEYFRNETIRGFVHDPGAAMYGGIGGHAGVFSNANDLAILLQMNLQDGYYGGQRYLLPGIVKNFSTPPFQNNRRGIGWDKPKLDGDGPTSDYASPVTYGHTGFTGTAAWVDPQFELVYIFLSNRTFPSAENSKLIKNNIRTRVQDIIYESIWNYEATHAF